MLLDRVGLDARLARADLAITAEGALDHRTRYGKTPRRGGPPREAGRRSAGVASFLTDATERALRMIQLGSRLPAGQAAALVSGTQRPSSVR